LGVDAFIRHWDHHWELASLLGFGITVGVWHHVSSLGIASLLGSGSSVVTLLFCWSWDEASSPGG